MAKKRPEDLHTIKVFPRNLTAHADYVVRGNPASSRPEAAVENSYPGLEFDVRNFEQKFLRGLHFEFHRDDGAILTRTSLDNDQKLTGLPDFDIAQQPESPFKKQPLFLWALYGKTAIQDSEPGLFGLRGQTGLEVWRRVHDLLPGRLAVMLGPAPGFNNPIGTASSPIDRDTAAQVLRQAYQATVPAQRFIHSQNPGEPEFWIFSQDRAPYLDENGVIDVNAYPPGELTKSLCAPWVYDFRDCRCFYWASNKPDIVDSSDGQYHFLNFIRKDRGDTPPQDVNIFKDPATGFHRDSTELTHMEMVEGWWQRLPVVLNDRESEVYVPHPGPTIPQYLNRRQVICELTYLATVEHALTVEYLYAFFSIKTTAELPPVASDTERRVFAAGQEVLRIAVDEMRHLRWANDALDILGAPPSIGRAKRIGAPPHKGDGRKHIASRAYLNHPFALERFTRKQLEWFIEVEQPSQVIHGQIDGMYVEILASIDKQPKEFPEAERLLPIIKLIIDEGGGHFERFTSIKTMLGDLDEGIYLRPYDRKPTAAQRKVIRLCDNYYQAILEAIRISFSMGERSSGLLLKAAIRSMLSLNEAALMLAVQDVPVPFNLPKEVLKPRYLTKKEAAETLNNREAKLRTVLDSMKKAGSESEKDLAEMQLGQNAVLYQQLHDLVEEHFEE